MQLAQRRADRKNGIVERSARECLSRTAWKRQVNRSRTAAVSKENSVGGQPPASSRHRIVTRQDFREAVVVTDKNCQA